MIDPSSDIYIQKDNEYDDTFVSFDSSNVSISEEDESVMQSAYFSYPMSEDGDSTDNFGSIDYEDEFVNENAIHIYGQDETFDPFYNNGPNWVQSLKQNNNHFLMQWNPSSLANNCDNNIEMIENQKNYCCQLCFYEPCEIPNVENWEQMERTWDSVENIHQQFLTPSPCCHNWEHAICNICLKHCASKKQQQWAVKIVDYQPIIPGLEDDNLFDHSKIIYTEKLYCLYPHENGCSSNDGGYKYEFIEKMLLKENHEPNAKAKHRFQFVCQLNPNYICLDMSYCIPTPVDQEFVLVLCVSKILMMQYETTVVPVNRIIDTNHLYIAPINYKNVYTQFINTVCVRCGHMDMLNLNKLNQTPNKAPLCNSCHMLDSSNVGSFWNRYIKRPQWIDDCKNMEELRDKLLLDGDNESEEWFKYQSPQFGHLVMNKHLTLSMVWPHVEKLLQSETIYCECFRTGTMIHKTSQCNSIDFCGINKCYITGKTMPMGQQLELSHWDPWKVPRFDEDPYWNQVIKCNWACTEGVCFTETTECTEKSHQPGKIARDEERRWLHLSKLYDSLSFKLKHFVYISIVNKYYNHTIVQRFIREYSK